MEGPPRYVMLAEYNGDPNALRPPPHRGNLPRYHSHSSRGGCCRCGCGCLCCCCCVLVLVLVLVLLALCYLYLFLDPKPPSYSVKDLSITSFDLREDLTLHAKLAVVVRADNPNTRIGIAYGSGSQVAISYRGAELCEGRLPSFYQGHRNTTVVTVRMEGQRKLGPEVQEALDESQKKGRIPLDVFVKVPVKLRVEEFDFREVKVSVHCTLVVDNLDPGKKPGIKSADYDVNVEW